MSSRIFSCISAFIEQLPSLSYRESPGSPHERGGFVNLEVVVAYMIAHTATIRLYATSMFVDDQQNRFNAALAIAHLAAALDGEEVQTQSQVLTVCPSHYHLLDLVLTVRFVRRAATTLLRSSTRTIILNVLVPSSFRP